MSFSFQDVTCRVKYICLAFVYDTEHSQVSTYQIGYYIVASIQLTIICMCHVICIHNIDIISILYAIEG